MQRSKSNGSKGQKKLDNSVVPEVREGLRSLLAAHRQAQAHGMDTWQFAVEMEELRRAGLTFTNLRALVLDGIVAHAREKTTRCGQRVFVKEGPLTLGVRSCFRLTSIGVAIVDREVNPHREKLRGSDFSPPPGNLSRTVPYWDGRTFSFADIRVRFGRYAPFQELILSSFQELNWPIRIDDPLPGGEPARAGERLHNAVKKLNRNLRETSIVFRCEPGGKGVICHVPISPRSQAQIGQKLPANPIEPYRTYRIDDGALQRSAEKTHSAS